MKTFRIIGLGLAVAIAVCARGDDRPGKGRSETKPGSSKTAVVAVGTLEPTEVADVGAQVAGRIEKLTVDYGTAVKMGDVLAQLETAPYAAEGDRARASVARAQAKELLARAQMTVGRSQLDRLLKLRDTKAVDESEVETAKAQLVVAEAALKVEQAGVAEAKAALERAMLDLSYCVIRSPIEGVVIDRRCSLGQMVAPSFSSPHLFLIGRDLKKLQVWASVKEADIVRVAAGQAAQFTVPAFPGQTFEGRVTQVRLNAAADKGAVTYTVTIDVDNHAGKLLPYMTAQVSIAVGERP
jgi:HlyD family secretion protein